MVDGEMLIEMLIERPLRADRFNTRSAHGAALVRRFGEMPRNLLRQRRRITGRKEISRLIGGYQFRITADAGSHHRRTHLMALQNDHG